MTIERDRLAARPCGPGGKVGMLSLEELQEHCRQAGLASYKKPLSLDVVDEIPKTSVGKLFRRALREPYWSGQERRVG